MKKQLLVITALVSLSSLQAYNFWEDVQKTGKQFVERYGADFLAQKDRLLQALAQAEASGNFNEITMIKDRLKNLADLYQNNPQMQKQAQDLKNFLIRYNQ